MNAFLTLWKQLAHEKKLTRYDMAFYCLSKALRSKEDQLQAARKYLSLAFTPVTKPVKLQNGMKPHGTLYNVLCALRGPLDTLANRPEMWGYNYGTDKNFKKELLSVLSLEDMAKAIVLIDQIKKVCGGGLRTPCTYVIIRQDLSPEQQIVQACHAALEAGLRFRKPEETSLVVLEVPNEKKLLEAGQALDKRQIENYIFNEPDNCVGFSALATRPILDKGERNFFKRWRTYVGKSD